MLLEVRNGLSSSRNLLLWPLALLCIIQYFDKQNIFTMSKLKSIQMKIKFDVTFLLFKQNLS